MCRCCNSLRSGTAGQTIGLCNGLVIGTAPPWSTFSTLRLRCCSPNVLVTNRTTGGCIHTSSRIFMVLRFSRLHRIRDPTPNQEHPRRVVLGESGRRNSQKLSSWPNMRSTSSRCSLLGRAGYADDGGRFRPWQGIMDPTAMRSSSSSKVTSRASTPKLVTTQPSGSSSSRTLKSNSTSHLPTMNSVAAASHFPQPHDRSRSDNLDFNTLSRTPTPLSNGSRTSPSSSPHHPDLSNEIAALSTKLINAINHQTNLDDSLQSTKGELDGAQKEIERLQRDLEEERRQRVHAERQKRRLEGEVEALTSSLFEEANSMVAQARHEHEDAEQRNEQLKGQLKDAETLLTSHQDQLRELKDVLQQMQSTQTATDATINPSTPGTPTSKLAGKQSAEFGQANAPSSNLPAPQVQPDHPLSFSSLLSPILRSDVSAFDDFVSMLKASQQATPSSRTNSGNFAGLNVMGISSLSNFSQSTVINRSPQLNNQSTSSLSTSSPVPQQPNIPGSFNSSADNASLHSASPTIASSLKDQKFYKRVLSEDIEPTLRLDAAPGLSWLSRRNMVTSMVSGNLIVEPFGPSHRYWSPSYACALCGESRDELAYIRRHRFYKGDTEDAQRYLVCDYCLGRLRATGDFVNFLRMVRSGYWKGESLEDSKAAWEHCTKLRERMFWSRVGGGVIPTVQLPASAGSEQLPNSPRSSRDTSAEDQPSDVPSVQGVEVPVIKPQPVGPLGRVSGAGSPERKPVPRSDRLSSFSGSPEREPVLRSDRPSSSSGSPERRETVERPGSSSGSPERRAAFQPDRPSSSSGSQRFLAARSKFESSTSDSSRPTTPAEGGALEKKRSDTPSHRSPSRSPQKASRMPGSLD